MSVVFTLILLAIGVYFVAVMKAWFSTGRLRLAAPITAGLALVGRESIVPGKPDRLFFEVAPPLLVVSAMLAFAVLPLSPNLVVADLATGALFLNAALAYVLVALIMAGWAPNGLYSMVGGWRFLGQVVAYSMLIVMPITAVAMRAESLVNTNIVASQSSLPNAVYQPIGFLVFVVAAMAVCFLPPLDLPTEFAGGVGAEYTGWRLAVFRLGRLLLVFTLASSITVFYLGGWSGPFFADWMWSAAKTLAVAAAMLFAGRFIPRVSEADFLSWCWKLGIPLALFNILLVGVMLLVGER